MVQANNWRASLPLSLKRLLGSTNWEVDEWGESDAHVYRIGQRFLKIAPYQPMLWQDQSILEAEFVRLQWLQKRLPVPTIQYYGHHGPYEFLLLDEIPGLVSCDEVFCADVPGVVRCLAQGLRMAHSTDITDCPFDATITVQLEMVRQWIQQRLIDHEAFTAEFQGMKSAEVYRLVLELRPGHEDRVFTHGDYCLPNILLDRQLKRVNGLIDWGYGGLADPYRDLALAARSLTRNFGEQWVPLLFEEYGLSYPDQDKLRFYRALDAITL